MLRIESGAKGAAGRRTLLVRSQELVPSRELARSWACSPVARRLAVLALFGAALTAAPDASAFCRTHTCESTATHECATDSDNCTTEGVPIAWRSSCIGFSMNALGTQNLDINQTRVTIQKSFATWSNVACPGGGQASFTFSPLADVSCKKSQYNPTGPNVNVVLFQDNDWTYKGIDGTLAKTAVTFDHDTGEIFDADIEVNSAFNALTITDDPSKIQYDLQSIITHEAGHFLGLAHTPDGTAVMYSTYDPGAASLRTLTPDDIAAICATYPPGRTATCDSTPHGGFSATCDDSPASGAKGCNAVGRPGSLADTGEIGILLLGVIFLRRRLAA